MDLALRLFIARRGQASLTDVAEVGRIVVMLMAGLRIVRQNVPDDEERSGKDERREQPAHDGLLA